MMTKNSNRKTTQNINANITLDKFTQSLLKKIPANQQGEVESMEENIKPEHVRAGGIEVAIWVNNNGKGDYTTITMQRSYKDKEDKWQKTNTLRISDIPKAVLALSKAYEKIVLKE